MLRCTLCSSCSRTGRWQRLLPLPRCTLAAGPAPTRPAAPLPAPTFRQVTYPHTASRAEFLLGLFESEEETKRVRDVLTSEWQPQGRAAMLHFGGSRARLAVGVSRRPPCCACQRLLTLKVRAPTQPFLSYCRS